LIRTGDVDERKKGWKRCGSFIFVSGNLSGIFKRKSTGRIAWDEAKAAEWEKARSWDGQMPSPPTPLPEPTPSRATIENAERFP